MLEKAFSFCLDLPVSSYSALRLGGKWANERNVYTAPLSHGITRIQSLRGSSSHQTNPFLGLLKSNCSEKTGECYGVQLIYSGSFAITAECMENGSVRLQWGINDVGFCWGF